MGKNQDPSLETIFWVKILKIFDTDPGWKKFRYWRGKIGSGIIKHPGSATLLTVNAVLRIRDVYPGSRILIFTHPGSRVQGSKRHRIPAPDPQH
jgi:hypothetical protein